jgi:hypothetical protein
LSSSEGRQRSTRLAGSGRRRLAGQRLARQQADGLGERRLAALGDARNSRAARQCSLERRREVLRHAGHAPGADRLDPRLLDRLEDRRAPPRRSAPREHAWRRRGGARRSASASASPRTSATSLGRQVARGQRQPRLVAGQPRLARREGGRQLRVCAAIARIVARGDAPEAARSALSASAIAGRRSRQLGLAGAVLAARRRRQRW